MDNFKRFPILQWNDVDYWTNIIYIIIFSSIAMYVILKFGFLSESGFPISFWLLVPILLLLLFAIDQKQKLLLQGFNTIITTTKNDIIKVLKAEEAINKLPSWSSIDNNNLKKFRRKYKIGFVILYLLCVLIAYLYYYLYLATQKDQMNVVNLPFITAWTLGMVYLFTDEYIKSFFIKKQLKEAINIIILILSNKNRDTNLLAFNWVKFKNRMLADWIVVSIIIVVTAILCWFNLITLVFTGLLIFLSMLLYPAIRLTIDLNIQFNRFSSALEKATADLFIKKDEEAK